MAPFTRKTVPRKPTEIADELPSNLEAECSVLGAILLDNSALKIAAERLAPDDFYNRCNATIFRQMLAMENQTMDSLTLFDALEKEGKLEAAGGAAYIAGLMDGVPRISNVEHYARIVREKSQLRNLAYAANTVRDLAIEGALPIDQVLDQYERMRGSLTATRRAKLVTVGLMDLLKRDLPPVEYVFEPLLSVKGIGMIFAPRGMGKTLFTMQLAHVVAAGLPEFFCWPIAKRRRVVLVDGELHCSTLKERGKMIAEINGLDRLPPDMDDWLQFVSRDFQKEVRPKINTIEGRHQIEALLAPTDLLILDNLSALSPSSDEKETEDWADIGDWLINLSWHGISTVFVHHAGKSGEQRGSSKREDLLDFVLKLRKPSDYEAQEGMRVEVHLDKKRYPLTSAAQGQPFEVALVADADGRPQWITRQLRELLRERARTMLADGMKASDVALETGLSRWAVARIARGLKYGPSAETGERFPS